MEPELTDQSVKEIAAEAITAPRWRAGPGVGPKEDARSGWGQQGGAWTHGAFFIQA